MNALTIALYDLKLLFRDRSWLFWIFVGPLLFTTFFGIMFRPQPSRTTTIDLVNRDAPDTVARILGTILEDDGILVKPAAEVAPDRWAIEIPAGASAALSGGRGVTLTFHSREREQTEAERRLQFRVEKALMATFLAANPKDLPVDASADMVRERLRRGEVITLRDGDLGLKRRAVTAGFQRSVPSYLVMFVFLNVLISGASIAEERASGRLRRLFIAPVRRGEIVAGKLLSRVAIGWIQTAYILAIGIVVFKIRWAEHSLVLFAFLTIFAAATGAVGILLGTLFKDPDKCQTAAVWTGILLAPLGGLWWPLEFVGSTMKTIGSLVPTGWAMQSVNAMLAFDAGAAEVAPQALAFIGLFAVAMTLAARRLKP